jgi:hypothetical protein
LPEPARPSDDQHARHDRTAGKVPVEEILVDRHRLDRNDRRVDDQLLDAVDEQHRVAMRQRRHHPLDIKRSDGGAAGFGVHRPGGCGWVVAGAACCRWPGCHPAGGTICTLGTSRLISVVTTAVMSAAG